MRPALAADRRRLARLARRDIAVLTGGWSAERDIALVTGRQVTRALRSLGLRIRRVDVRGWPELAALGRRRPDLAFLCLHGTGGEDGRVQAVCECMGVPYTGSGVLASALAMDKARTKMLLAARGVPTPPWVLVGSASPRMTAGWRPPVVVKPNQQGSAVGVTIARSRPALRRALGEAKEHGGDVLVERYVPGVEITVGVLGGRALPVVEIVPKKAFYDYEAKYAPGMSEHIVPARIPAAIRRRAQRLAEAAHHLLGCRGATRADFIVDAAGEPMLLEMNTLPGLTPTSLLPDAARAAGIDFETLVLRIAAEALEGVA